MLTHPMSLLAPPPRRLDGRHQRSQRTKELITEAYLGLLRESHEVPTASQIAERAGCSTRTVFGRFKDFAELSVATCDYVIAQGQAATPLGDEVNAGRGKRLEFQVETRARNCEDWLPLYRMLVRYEERVPALKARVHELRDLTRTRLQAMYRPELSTLPDAEREALLIALESLTEFENWGRMRELHGLSFEAACAVWVNAIDRLLPPTPAAAAA